MYSYNIALASRFHQGLTFQPERDNFDLGSGDRFRGSVESVSVWSAKTVLQSGMAISTLHTVLKLEIAGSVERDFHPI